MEENINIIEARQELMVSPSSAENQTFRTAYFLKPCNKEHSYSLPPHFFISSQTTTNLPLEVKYNGWRTPQDEWKKWVNNLRPKFEFLWIKTGIYHAITASTYEINRDDELILQLASRWCSKTNTFVFPWGESTITLEDTNVCFGYSLLGDSISKPLENSEQEEAEEELIEARRMFHRSKAKKCNQFAWMRHFMETESKVEHEAFLVYWLSRFVFPSDSYDTISKAVFPIAIHLAHGDKIALAPAVLASIYRDLTLFNSTINENATTTIKSFRETIWAPFQLVQIWALERFQALKPRPYGKAHHGLPKVARWGGIEMMKTKILKKVMDCAGFGDGFLWQPYENSPCIEVYNEKDMWRCGNPCLDKELESFSQCLRVCELVGMGCKEKYFPHRVAMQFGMDQDIPGEVFLCKKDPWMIYDEPIPIDIDLLIQLCSRQPNVTSRYYDWWQQSKSSEGGDNNRIKVEKSDGLTPPGFTSKFEKHQKEASDEGDHLVYVLSSSDDEVVGNGKALCSPEFGDFTSSGVLDEDEIKSLFCDRNGEEGESVGPLILDIAFDVENRIQKLEREVAKLKQARFGSKG